MEKEKSVKEENSKDNSGKLKWLKYTRDMLTVKDVEDAIQEAYQHSFQAA